jgi:hypothetical protein
VPGNREKNELEVQFQVHRWKMQIWLWKIHFFLVAWGRGIDAITTAKKMEKFLMDF